jgi:uncharacterized SAM-binding protein YcdF (DUF218 family)
MFVDFLKTLPTVANYITVWLLLLWWLYHIESAARFYVQYIGVVILLLASTTYVPRKLIMNIERQYMPLDTACLDTSAHYYIVILGAGAGYDADLPGAMNLNSATLTRLAEGVRMFKASANATLVTSAAGDIGSPVSQAQLVKDAAIGLGVPPHAIASLHTPNTTLEEALAFKEAFGTHQQIILVTSALHMPRAVAIFNDLGMSVLPAPTDYICLNDATEYQGVTLPGVKSLRLANAWQRAMLKSVYYQYVTKLRLQEGLSL